MNQIRRKSIFWSIAGPVIIYLGIRLLVEIVCICVISFPYLTDAYGQMVSRQSSVSMEQLSEQYWNLMQPAMDMVYRYMVHIAGLAALFTIPVNGYLFIKDRKLEKACGMAEREKALAGKYWPILVFGLAVSAAATCLFAMIELAFYSGQTESAAQSAYYMPAFAVQIIVLGVIVPVAEELLFRGIMFKRLMETRGFVSAALWSSLFFLLMHQDGTQMTYAMLLGIFLCYVYEKFGSLRAPVLLHVAANCSSLIYSRTGLFRWIGGAPLRMAGTVIIGTFICSAMYVLIQRTGGPVKKEKTSENENF